MRDFNTYVNTTGVEIDKFDEFCNYFGLTNLIKTKACCAKSNKSTIDLFLRNRPLSFQKIKFTETQIGDYHKLFQSFLNLVILV